MKIVSCLLLTTVLSLGLGNSAVMGEELSQTMLRNPSNQTQYHAQRPHRGMKDRGQRRIMEQLNLSEEQTQELASIRQKYQPQIEPLMEQMRANRQEMQQMMTGNASPSDIRSKHQEISQIRQQLDNLRFESLLEMRQVLTPEQRQEFAQLMEERRETRGPRGRRARPPREEGENLAP